MYVCMYVLRRVAEFTRNHPAAEMLLVNDQRYMYSLDKRCLQHSLALNMGTSPKHMVSLPEPDPRSVFA